MVPLRGLKQKNVFSSCRLLPSDVLTVVVHAGSESIKTHIFSSGALLARVGLSFDYAQNVRLAMFVQTHFCAETCIVLVALQLNVESACVVHVCRWCTLRFKSDTGVVNDSLP